MWILWHALYHALTCNVDLASCHASYGSLYHAVRHILMLSLYHTMCHMRLVSCHASPGSYFKPCVMWILFHAMCRMQLCVMWILSRSCVPCVILLGPTWYPPRVITITLVRGPHIHTMGVGGQAPAPGRPVHCCPPLCEGHHVRGRGTTWTNHRISPLWAMACTPSALSPQPSALPSSPPPPPLPPQVGGRPCRTPPLHPGQAGGPEHAWGRPS